MNEHRKEQQQNRLTTLPDDAAISLDFVKSLLEAQTGKPIKSITPRQVFGASANYTGDNRAFFAISITLFPSGNES